MSTSNRAIAASSLGPLGGMELVSVTFRVERLEIVLWGDAGATLTMLAWPVASVGGMPHTAADTDYPDALCSLIGRRVEGAELVSGVALTIAFEGGDDIMIPLSVSGGSSREAARLVLSIPTGVRRNTGGIPS